MELTGQDLRQNHDFAAIINVEGHLRPVLCQHERNSVTCGDLGIAEPKTVNFGIKWADSEEF